MIETCAMSNEVDTLIVTYEWRPNEKYQNLDKLFRSLKRILLQLIRDGTYDKLKISYYFQKRSYKESGYMFKLIIIYLKLSRKQSTMK